ncbi:uncharacterized protein LOC111271162 isoform X4 [Varroa jacobsoni]|nr:uncharacterized protein LOC111271162 isoform X4 [Varroa jacobsoni]
MVPVANDNPGQQREQSSQENRLRRANDATGNRGLADCPGIASGQKGMIPTVGLPPHALFAWYTPPWLVPISCFNTASQFIDSGAHGSGDAAIVFHTYL